MITQDDIKIFEDMSDEDFFSDKLTHIYFNSNVSQDSVSDLIRDIEDANLDQVLPSGAIIKPKPILIHISSNGGSLTEGMRMLSVFALSSVPIATIVDSISASAATFLSINSHYRLINKYAFSLIHNYSLVGKFHDKITQLKQTIKMLDITFDQIIERYESRTFLKKEQLLKILEHDLLLNANICLKYGLVDRIIDIKKNNNKKFTTDLDVILNTKFNSIMVSCEKSTEKIDNILFSNNLAPVILFPRRYSCNGNYGDNDSDPYKSEPSIIKTLNIVPRILCLKCPVYAIIEGSISIDDLLPLLFCDHIYIFDYALIVCNILYYYDSSGFFIEDNLRNTKEIFKIIKSVLKEKTNMPNDMINDINKKFTFINAKKAAELKICNTVIDYNNFFKKSKRLSINASIIPPQSHHKKTSSKKNKKSSKKSSTTMTL
jgi:ATP-dependent Clp protease protease subunit